jgi:hypothetical protein
LTDASVDNFIKQNEGKPVTRLNIQSRGGELAAGIKLGRWVRKHDADVQVTLFCMSSCANYVFPAGKNKIISPDALVLWHGHAEQKELREQQDKFRESPVAEGKARYEKIEQQRAMQAEFFKELGIDGALFLLGYEPVKHDTDSWSATVDVMKKFGINAVTAPADYGTVGYMNKSFFRKLLFKDARLTFELDADGQVIAAPVGKTTK